MENSKLKTKINFRLNISLFIKKAKKDLNNDDTNMILFTFKEFLKEEIKKLTINQLKITNRRV